MKAATEVVAVDPHAILSDSAVAGLTRFQGHGIEKKILRQKLFSSSSVEHCHSCVLGYVLFLSFFKTFITFPLQYNFHERLFFNIYILNVINRVGWRKVFATIISDILDIPVKTVTYRASCAMLGPFCSHQSSAATNFPDYCTPEIYIYPLYTWYTNVYSTYICSTVVVVIPCILFRQLGYI